MATALISSALGLIAFTGGMFLLAKTKKELLGVFFKIASYFIICVSLLLILCTAFHGIIHSFGKFHKMDGYENNMAGFNRQGGMGNCGSGCCGNDKWDYRNGYRDACQDNYFYKHDGHGAYDWNAGSNNEMKDTSNTNLHR
jgi:hypothetical protein